MSKLRGLAWDHRRCWGPLEASVAPYEAANPGLEISWDRRSLYDFGEGPLDDILSRYDLVIFDHPFVGEVAAGGLMASFDDHLTAASKAAFEADSVGRSWQSYRRDGRQWALPIDAACQVASYRPDLLSRFGDVPTRHEEVMALARALAREGLAIGLPMVPTDALCLILTLASPDELAEHFIAREALERALDQLRELAAVAHPASPSWNPILCYDHMVAHDDVAYVPFAFGYVNYAARRETPRLAFANVPTPACAGALLGGAGIGVSARSPERAAAVAYALYLCSAEFQRGIYVDAGGQPGSLSAWRDPDVNAATNDFFSATLKTIEASYLRPTHAGFLAFFRDTAPRAAGAIAGELSAAELWSFIDRRYRASLPKKSASRSVA